MAIKKTIGGDRVGSGNKMQTYLHEYNRSTHNLSEKWASTMGAGILYPAMCKLATRGDSFDIEINGDCRTIPTKGALFGSFKFQVDVYSCPVRLYQALLHNNPLAIGLNASQIKFPMLHVKNKQHDRNYEDGNFSNSCLLKYLGVSGMGTYFRTSSVTQQNEEIIERHFNAIPALAYYDIFKNYYSNKQEDNAYIITTEGERVTTDAVINSFTTTWQTKTTPSKQVTSTSRNTSTYVNVPKNSKTGTFILFINGSDLNYEIKIQFESANESITLTIEDTITNQIATTINRTGTEIYLAIDINNLNNYFQNSQETNENINTLKLITAAGEVINKTQLTPFELKNIDNMRYDILSHHTLGAPFIIGQDSGEQGQYMPYSVLVNDIIAGENTSRNKTALNGLLVKTYQNDIFNNWLNQEWIEGENSINELTKVAIIDGAFSMDALNMAQKLYNMLNRVAISGGTYEDYQDVVWEEVKRRQIESPIYCGGMSREIMFDEVIQTAPAEGDALGSLGGRGQFTGNQKGGKIHIKCEEACFIIAIVSITPRIFQTQGNEFYMTELESFDDLHKPALDGIGFQDLLGERMVAASTTMNPNNTTPRGRVKIGKLPAWIEYMTSIDKAFGDFAETGGRGYMILNRNYTEENGIFDFTTYIDPAKYNYAFAYTELDAQNFWVELGFNIKARRLMSARIIPNV